MPDYDDETQQQDEQQPAPAPEPQKVAEPPRALTPNQKIALVQAGVPIEPELLAPPEEVNEIKPIDEE